MAVVRLPFIFIRTFNDFFFSPLIRCSLPLRSIDIAALRSRLCLCSAKFLYRMGSAYRLHRRTCYTKKEPPRRISEVLKVAATYSPTTQCSTIGDAVSLYCSPLSLSALSPAPARRRRAQPTPRMAHTAPHSATPPPMRHTYHPQKRSIGLSNKVFGNPHGCIYVSDGKTNFA